VVFVVAVVLVLILIAFMIVLLARYRRRKRRLVRQQQAACASAVDETFHPYIVDDAATDKLSCVDQTPEIGICQASCASNGSPRHPATYTVSSLDSAMPRPTANIDKMMRTHEYGSNAADLETAGRPPDTSRSPQFIGRSPLNAAKRSVPPANGEAAKGLNNLNKVENYRKKSTCLFMQKFLKSSHADPRPSYDNMHYYAILITASQCLDKLHDSFSAKGTIKCEYEVICDLSMVSFP